MDIYFVTWTFIANYCSNSNGDSTFIKVEADSVEDAISKAYPYDLYENERGSRVTFHVFTSGPVHSGHHPSLQDQP